MKERESFASAVHYRDTRPAVVKDVKSRVSRAESESQTTLRIVRRGGVSTGYNVSYS